MTTKKLASTPETPDPIESKPKSRRGGARPNSGRHGQNDSEDPYVRLTIERARHEAVKADVAEMNRQELIGQLLRRCDVEVASSRLHAVICQTLRQLPDTLERKCNATPEMVEAVQNAIDELTLTIQAKLAAI